MHGPKRLLLVIAAISLVLGIQNTVKGCSLFHARSTVNPCLCSNEVQISYTLALEAGEHIDRDDVLLIEFEPDPNLFFRQDLGDLTRTPFNFVDEVPVCDVTGPRCAEHIFTRGYTPPGFLLTVFPSLPIPVGSNVYMWSSQGGGVVNEDVVLGFFHTIFRGGIVTPPFAMIAPRSVTIYRADGTLHYQCSVGDVSDEGNGAIP